MQGVAVKQATFSRVGVGQATKAVQTNSRTAGLAGPRDQVVLFYGWNESQNLSGRKIPQCCLKCANKDLEHSQLDASLVRCRG